MARKKGQDLHVSQYLLLCWNSVYSLTLYPVSTCHSAFVNKNVSLAQSSPNKETKPHRRRIVVRGCGFSRTVLTCNLSRSEQHLQPHFISGPIWLPCPHAPPEHCHKSFGRGLWHQLSDLAHHKNSGAIDKFPAKNADWGQSQSSGV